MRRDTHKALMQLTMGQLYSLRGGRPFKAVFHRKESSVIEAKRAGTAAKASASYRTVAAH